MRAFKLSEIKTAFSDLKIAFEMRSETTQQFSAIATDTRKEMKGQLFLALVGEAFDAHQFLETAVKQGASGILAHHFEEDFIQKYSSTVTLILVPDTLLALQALGTWSRRQFQGKVIGITGSNGKTTTKEFTASVLSTKYQVHYSKGSFNNHWGVPFSLLQIPSDAQVAVIEMGMNHFGEITRLVQIAEPDIVLCTMVGRAHIEHFGSEEKIALAKAEIYEAASGNAVFAFNLDNPWTHKMFQKYQSQSQTVKTFSSHLEKADVHLRIKAMTLEHLEVEGQIAGVSKAVTVPVFGEQNIVNLMSAAVLGLCAGLSAYEVWKGLSNCHTIWGRNQILQLKSGAQVLFDAYNANPDSMKALLLNIQKISCQGHKIGVFGEMLEMGEQAAQLHFELGEQVAQSGFEKVYFVGANYESFTKGLMAKKYSGIVQAQAAQSQQMITDLQAAVGGQDLLVFKGSRGMRLENLLRPLEPLDWIEKN